MLAYLRAQGRELGLLDIGYHFVIERDGRVFTGRPLAAVGSHCPGFNDDSVGICLAGGHEGRDDFTDAQRDSLLPLLSYIQHEYPDAALEVRGDSELRRWRRGSPCPALDMERLRADIRRYIDVDEKKDTLPPEDGSMPLQQRIVLEYLFSGRRLTNNHAITSLGIGSLTSRVAELRKKGWAIQAETKKDFWGAPYKSYFLPGPEPAAGVQSEAA